MEFLESLTTNNNLVLLVVIIFIGFAIISLVRTLLKCAIGLIIITAGASILFGLTPEEVIEKGFDSTRISREFFEQKIQPIIGDIQLEEFFERDQEIL